MKAKPRAKAKVQAKAMSRVKAKAKPKGKAEMSAPLKLRVWYNARDGRIRLVAPGHFISTVTDKAGARCHKHLFNKLRTLLKKRGKWFELA